MTTSCITPNCILSVGHAGKCSSAVGGLDHKTVPQKYNHYFKNVEKFTHIDVYRVLELFSVTDPCIQHAVKKLLVAGGRGSKDIDKDIEEAIVSLKRWQQMRYEENAVHEGTETKS